MAQTAEWWTWFRRGLGCRACCVVLQAVFAQLPDHRADAYYVPGQLSRPQSAADRAAELLLGGLAKWDAQHYIAIAASGYTEIHQHAFLPLLPTVLRAAAALLGPALGLGPYHAVLVAGALLSAVCFAAACAELSVLARMLAPRGAPERVSACACCALLLSPASVFFSACYTEALFAALTFAALRRLGEGRSWTAALLLATATAARSNGVVAAGFAAHCGLRAALAAPRARAAAWALASAAAQGALVVTPFLCWQAVGYAAYCSAAPPAWLGLLGVVPADRGALGPEQLRWCAAPLPSLYGHVQREYWGGGVFAYWRLKQAPNFLLALPVLLLTAAAARAEVRRAAAGAGSTAASIRAALGLGARQSAADGLRVAMAWHAAFLGCFALVCMHVQVSTRLLLSNCPLLYIACGEWLAADPRLGAAFRRRSPALATPRSRALLLYGAGYTLLGHLLFCNFLPWT